MPEQIKDGTGQNNYLVVNGDGSINVSGLSSSSSSSPASKLFTSTGSVEVANTSGISYTLALSGISYQFGVIAPSSSATFGVHLKESGTGYILFNKTTNTGGVTIFDPKFAVGTSGDSLPLMITISGATNGTYNYKIWYY